MSDENIFLSADKDDKLMTLFFGDEHYLSQQIINGFCSFVESEVIKEKGSILNRVIFYDAYVNFCKQNNIISMSNQKFYSALRRTGFLEYRNSDGRYFVDIKLKDSEDIKVCNCDPDIFENIRNPEYYQLFDEKDASDVMSACMSVTQLKGYWRGCVLKYAIRLGRKGTEEDAQKDAQKLAECALRLAELYKS